MTIGQVYFVPEGSEKSELPVPGQQTKPDVYRELSVHNT